MKKPEDKIMSIVDASCDDSVVPMVGQTESLDWESSEHDIFTETPELPYLPTQWEQHLDLLQHLSHHNNLLLVVVGEKGIGKSTLLKQFLIESLPNATQAASSQMHGSLPKNEFNLLVDENTRACHVMGDVAFGPDRLLDLITEAFGLPEVHTENIQEQSDIQIENIQKLPYQSLLIIDDAHLLPLETLHTILYLLNQQSETQMRLHILLLGLDMLQRNLNRISEQHFHSDLVCLLELESFNYHETEQYLQHYLKAAGKHELEWFSPEQVERIYQLSHGVPLQINNFARQISSIDTEQSSTGDASMMSSLQTFFEQHRNKLIGGLVVLALVIAVIYSISNRTDVARAGQQPNIEMSQAVESTTTTVAQAVEQQQSLQSAPVATMAASGVNPPGDTDIQEQAIKNTTPGNVPDAPQMDQGYSTKQPPSIIIESPQGTNGTTNGNTNSNGGTNGTNKNKDQSKIQPSEEESSALDVEVKDKAVIIQHKKPNEVNPAKEKAASNKTTTTVAHNHTTTSADNGAYALQLVGLSDKQRVNNFISNNHLQGKVTYRQSVRQGKDWFVIFYGKYASMQQAQAAVKTLPKSLQDLHPFPKRVDADMACKKTEVHQTAVKSKTQHAHAQTTTAQPKPQMHASAAKTTKTQVQASAAKSNSIDLTQTLEG